VCICDVLWCSVVNAVSIWAPSIIWSSLPSLVVGWQVMRVLAVALNYQTCGLMMDLNDGRFMQNGGCGYVLKPAVMRDEIAYFRAGTRDIIPGISPQILHIKVCIIVIRGWFVSLSVISPQILHIKVCIIMIRGWFVSLSVKCSVKLILMCSVVSECVVNIYCFLLRALACQLLTCRDDTSHQPVDVWFPNYLLESKDFTVDFWTTLHTITVQTYWYRLHVEVTKRLHGNWTAVLLHTVAVARLNILSTVRLHMYYCFSAKDIGPSSIVHPVVISQKQSKIDPIEYIRKLALLTLLPHSHAAQKLPSGDTRGFKYKICTNINMAFCSTWHQTTAVVNQA